MPVTSQVSSQMGGPVIERSHRGFRIKGTIKLIELYVLGGMTWDLTAMTLPPGWTLPGAAAPLDARLESQAAGGDSGFVYRFVPGSDLTNSKIQIFVQDGVATNPLAELAGGALPAGVTDDTIEFELFMPTL